MYGSKRIDRRNYRSLIIAGAGSIGGSLIMLGDEQFSLFERIFAIDKDHISLRQLRNPGIIRQRGDITDAQFLQAFMASVPGPSLFVNLCSGTDNVKIRRNLARDNIAYLDSCASTTPDPREYRFSRMMPYTYTEIHTRFPHWLCWGINPGLVEIIARRILSDLPQNQRYYDVTVYEFDRLVNGAEVGKTAVSWCIEALVEEMMLSPTMEVIEGMPREDGGPGTRNSTVNWDGRLIRAKVVGHEDIWNLAAIPAVKNGRFYYSLNPSVMDILSEFDAEKARSLLYIPGRADPISGLEQVAVQVKGKNTAESRTLVWTEDHTSTHKRFGMNAVQYQTAKSLLLAIMLLQRTEYGLEPFSFNASSLPIIAADWPVFDRFMLELGIRWHDGASLNLHAVGNS